MKVRMIAGMLLLAILSFGTGKKASAQGYCRPRLSISLNLGGGYGHYYAPPPPPPPCNTYSAPVYSYGPAYSYAPAYSYNNYSGYGGGYYRGGRRQHYAPRRAYGYCR